ncbi:YceI family protein [Geobacter argillaceus]|uniref:Polyisoprenoid-binding protein YceI n=1 Tax=Geobacter argillaceus TaxID=345631 RepID=A0A562VI29_9BACT|nr:YceI family protein [Geobacter argillaceus]TWJ17575.1 polyisoprenoid-binding protein YceI [Geobacter argillaceus]
MSVILSCNELVHRIDAGAVVIDVMTPEEYAIRHVAGAKNVCIYEMVFLDHIAEQVPDRDTELIVYDATGTTRSAELARERLLQAGYADVSILSGGLAAWRDAGLPVEADEQAFVTEPELRDGTYRIDNEKSTLEWIGRNLNKRHYGRITIQAGELVIANGKLSTGNIVLDMTTISNLDLQDPGWRDMLIRHLISDDFFAVERYPTSSFTLNGWEAQVGASPEAPQGIVTGELTIKDVTRPISFPATVAPQQDGSIQAHAAFDIDRTLWNICYGSCRMFEHLGMHLVHDMISLELFVVARRP